MIGSWLAFDVAGDFVFGQSFWNFEIEDSHFMVKAILASLDLDLLLWSIGRQTLQKCVRWREDISKLLTTKQSSSDGLYSSVSGVQTLPRGEEPIETEFIAESQVLLVTHKSFNKTQYD